ncbi:MAG TPA: methylmalonyl Co-A mutase-associated GTPase MeaB [Halieaceae bacterium]|jgi:LAO/AO transport system kinase|nr:methylmalonyl Co-A mutase-associated GTPase MeaB [Halieaceae bacterium]
MSISLDALVAGDRRALAKAITLIESSRSDHRAAAQELLGRLLPQTGHSLRIGISGVPGVGKSTFIERFGLLLLALGKRVAVLAVDPSSPAAGGSILGDKTRMEVLSRSSDAFIRPSPAGRTLGGVAQRTRETLLLCEAAGFDVILVETVGVGQSEHQVAGMVDFFMLLMLPGGGDELQGIKKGILELADALVINKADGDSKALAAQAQQHYQNALHLLSHPSFWTPKVVTCSALEDQGIDSIWTMITDFTALAQANGVWNQQRKQQKQQWLHQLIQEGLQAKLFASKQAQTLLPKVEAEVANDQLTAYQAATKILDLL